MSRNEWMRRAAPAAFGAIALIAAAAGHTALARPDAPIRNIRVDVSPLRARAGDPTAAWVAQELPGELAQALAGRMSPHGGTLTVSIDFLTLGTSSGGPGFGHPSYDNIQGVATIGGVQTPVRATSTYYPMSVDQVLFEQSNHDRVSSLTQMLARWIAEDPDL